MARAWRLGRGRRHTHPCRGSSPGARVAAPQSPGCTGARCRSAASHAGPRGVVRAPALAPPCPQRPPSWPHAYYSPASFGKQPRSHPSQGRGWRWLPCTCCAAARRLPCLNTTTSCSSSFVVAWPSCGTPLRAHSEQGLPRGAEGTTESYGQCVSQVVFCHCFPSAQAAVCCCCLCVRPRRVRAAGAGTRGHRRRARAHARTRHCCQPPRHLAAGLSTGVCCGPVG